MKRATLVFAVVALLLAVAGAAIAMETSGVVTAVDMEKNTITIKSQTMDASYDCETGSLLSGVKVGDQVNVEYREAGGKKTATKITKKRAPVGC